MYETLKRYNVPDVTGPCMGVGRGVYSTLAKERQTPKSQ